jgi:hypothetical protein
VLGPKLADDLCPQCQHRPMSKNFMATQVTQFRRPGAEGYANLLPAVDLPARLLNCHRANDSV